MAVKAKLLRRDENGYFSLRSFSEAVGGTVVSVGRALSRNEMLGNVIIDSREATAGSLFVALRGRREDGERYIADAFRHGAAAVLCRSGASGRVGSAGIYVEVDDPIIALGVAARRVRRDSGFTVVGITGSVGKTTVKELCKCVLSERYPTDGTKGNYNNLLGVCLSILNAFGTGAESRTYGKSPEKNGKYLVLEMGISRLGEMDALCETALPDIAVITNVGSMHGEYLGGRAGIAAEKARIAAFGAKAVICPDDPLILNEVARCTDIGNITVMLIGGEISDGAVNTVTVCKNGAVAGCGRFDVIFTDSLGQNIKYTGFTAPIVGDHGVHDSALAVTLGLRLGMSVEDIKSGLRRYTAVSMRQEIRRDGEITRIIDCYNSGPESARAALSALAEYSDVYGCERRIAVLGDMLELGDASEREHRALGGVLSSYGVELLFTVGERAELIAAGALENGFAPSRVRSFSADTPRDEIGRVIEAALRPRDIVLYKASRGIGLEGVIGYGRN